LIDILPPWGHGLVALTAFFVIAIGAKAVVDAASSLAARLGVSELVIGLTVVAFGTSAPEFGVTLVAAFEGRAEISIGNIVGSNIFNLGFILGGAALLRAIPTSTTLVWRDATALVAATILLLLLVGRDLQLGRVDGAILLLLLFGYLFYLWTRRKDQVGETDDEHPSGPTISFGSPLREAAHLVAGLIVVGFGSHLLVESASALARDVGVSEWVIAVTIVAAGTSVPELATTLAGVARGRMAIAAGNIIGSDLFNILGVLGVAGIAQPMALDPSARGSLIALSGMAVIALFFLRTGWRVRRIEGLMLVLLGLLRWVLDFTARI
jgi:cation:H+ antiporter